MMWVQIADIREQRQMMGIHLAYNVNVNNYIFFWQVIEIPGKNIKFPKETENPRKICTHTIKSCTFILWDYLFLSALHIILSEYT